MSFEIQYVKLYNSYHTIPIIIKKNEQSKRYFPAEGLEPIGDFNYHIQNVNLYRIGKDNLFKVPIAYDKGKIYIYPNNVNMINVITNFEESFNGWLIFNDKSNQTIQKICAEHAKHIKESPEIFNAIYNYVVRFRQQKQQRQQQPNQQNKTYDEYMNWIAEDYNDGKPF